MRVLIHICCAPCLYGPLESLRAEGMDLAGLFYNPNIHPFLEFRKRIKALRVFMESDNLPVKIIEDYGLHEFIAKVYSPDRSVRCRSCYRIRLFRTAAEAHEQGFDAFTTTLLGSPRQDHDGVRAAGEQAAERNGLKFLYRDWRPLHDRSREMAQKRRLYLQQYCGCCFSEYERFRDTTRELYRGNAHSGGESA